MDQTADVAEATGTISTFNEQPSRRAYQSVEQTYGAEKPRYYVIMVGGGAPTFMHRTRYRAECEAKRLAALYPDRLLHVVKVKSSYLCRRDKVAQEEARAKLKIGQSVFISPHHFRNPNEVGEIKSFTDKGAVEVALESGDVWAFAPTSLFTKETVPAE